LSKEIRKHLRKQLRAKRNNRVTQILDEFSALNRSDSAFRDPIRFQKQIQKKPQPEEFASYLGDVFRSDVGHNASVLDMLNRPGPTAFRLSSFLSWNMCLAKCHATKQQMLLESWSKCTNMEKLYCAHVC
jgi:hypothetical protein